MRVVVTFILRLLVDSDLPKGVRGTLQRIPEQRTYPFENREALLSLLDLNSSLPDQPGGNLPGMQISPEKSDSCGQEERKMS